MKNKEETTNIHYNLLSNRRHAINTAMQLYSSFCGVKVRDVDGMAKAFKPCNDKEQIMNWLKGVDKEITKGEITEMQEMLKDISNEEDASNFYGKEKCASSKVRIIIYC